ncbi:MAG: AraC family ligand binding domain-containing protein, partial [Cytophagales bacterium]
MFESYEILDFLEFQNDGKRHFHINRLDEMPELPAKIKSPHKHLFYEVFLITQGKANHNIDYKEYRIRAKSLFFISQGQLHLWSKSDRSAIKGYRLMFTEEFFLIKNSDKNFLFELVFLDNVYFNPCIKLTKKDAEPMRIYFNLLFIEYHRLEPNPKVLQSWLLRALTDIQ